MTEAPAYREEFDLNHESTRDSDEFAPFLSKVEQSYPSSSPHFRPTGTTVVGALRHALSSLYRYATRITRRPKPRPTTHTRIPSRRSIFRRFVLLSYFILGIMVASIIIVGTFFPSYTHLPANYTRLKDQVGRSIEPGRANLAQEKVFIAASIYDRGGHLAGGSWAQNVLDLIDLLGPDNVHLSIYENDSGPEAKEAFQSLKNRLPCNHTLVYDEHIDLSQLPRVTLANGTKRIKRIAYLAEVRNKALKPLDDSLVKFDKLLYLNDVVFDALDAAQLLFSTHTNEHGQAEYRAACAVDFISPFKFYDTYATRDMAGYTIGLPFFPWFAASGDANSHSDVLRNKDAVRVRSCWGGMVAFDARFFQEGSGRTDVITAGNQSPSNLTAPYRFRAEEDTYWDGSECCLIHADIQNPEPGHSGIYMNPFIRVAYDTRTLSWLRFLRRFEQLYTPIHYLLDISTGKPGHNARRDEQPWQHVEETVWVADEHSPNGGAFELVPRIANHAGFCGRPKLSVLKENITEGDKNWEFSPAPSP